VILEKTLTKHAIEIWCEENIGKNPW